VIRHWDEVQPVRRERGHLAGEWQRLTGSDTVQTGVSRVRVDPGGWSTPAHVHGAEEEIVYVLGGSGLAWRDGEVHELRPGDCVVRPAGEEANTMRGGGDGLVVLVFGMRVYDEAAVLPRAGVGWFGAGWVRLGGEEDHPWAREAAAVPPEVGEPSPRPPTIVNVADVEPAERETATIGRRQRDLGRAAGSEDTGLRISEVFPGKLNVGPHCHSAEEEIFVVLAGTGSLLLWGETTSPEPTEEHEVREGHIVSRRAGTGVAHAFRGGDDGLTILMYGTRDPRDICFYPRSNKIFVRGVGIVARLEQVDFWDGEA
jgi:uncharacterized cupin superfamily protein